MDANHLNLKTSAPEDPNKFWLVLGAVIGFGLVIGAGLAFFWHFVEQPSHWVWIVANGYIAAVVMVYAIRLMFQERRASFTAGVLLISGILFVFEMLLRISHITSISILSNTTFQDGTIFGKGVVIPTLDGIARISLCLVFAWKTFLEWHNGRDLATDKQSSNLFSAIALTCLAGVQIIVISQGVWLGS